MTKDVADTKKVVKSQTTTHNEAFNEAIELLGISKDQEAAIKLVAQRAGEQMGQMVTAMIEDVLILILSSQHQLIAPNISIALSDKAAANPEKQVSPPTYKLLRAAEVAKLLDVSRTQAYHMMVVGEIPTVRFGRLTRVKPEDLRDFINKRRLSEG